MGNASSEIRRQILLTLELRELNALVHASPFFHEQYRQDRKFILWNHIETSLGRVTVDAHAVCKSKLITRRIEEEIDKFVVQYQEQRCHGQHQVLSKTLSEEEVVGMVVFHHSVVIPLFPQYTNWALLNIPRLQLHHVNPTNNSHAPAALNSTEDFRVMRALYRFQLCSNLFGFKPSVDSPSGSLSRGDFRGFCMSFFPREVEEIACIYTFSVREYVQIFTNVCSPASVSRVFDAFFNRHRLHPHTNRDILGVNGVDDILYLAKRTASHGLDLLHTVLKKETRNYLYSTIQQNVPWPANDFRPNNEVVLMAQLGRFEYQQSNWGIPCKACKGHRVPGEKIMEPPLAWVWIIERGAGFNGFESQVEHMRHCGYILWDEARLEQTDAKMFMKYLWYTADDDD